MLYYPHIILLATALIGSVVIRESCNIFFIVTFPDYVHLYDVCDSEKKLLTFCALPARRCALILPNKLQLGLALFTVDQ